MQKSLQKDNFHKMPSLEEEVSKASKYAIWGVLGLTVVVFIIMVICTIYFWVYRRKFTDACGKTNGTAEQDEEAANDVIKKGHMYGYGITAGVAMVLLLLFIGYIGFVMRQTMFGVAFMAVVAILLWNSITIFENAILITGKHLTGDESSTTIPPLSLITVDNAIAGAQSAITVGLGISFFAMIVMVGIFMLRRDQSPEVGAKGRVVGGFVNPISLRSTRAAQN
jgi:hypothetical protein